MIEQVALLVCGAAVGVLALLAWQRSQPQVAEASAAGSGAPGAAASAQVADLHMQTARRVLEPGTPSRTVYLNREGAELTGGPDDSAFNVASIVATAPGNRASVPAFEGSAARWNAIVKCIRDKFAPFAIRVVERRPVEPDYIMTVLGGTPRNLGYNAKDGHAHSHAVGLAPFNGEPIPNAVVFVFTRSLREEVQATCEAAGMEIAHAYGLDHARNCRDLMTYLPGCGPRRFVDQDIPCGEHAERPCEGGARTQNSYRHLLTLLGPAAAAAAAK